MANTYENTLISPIYETIVKNCYTRVGLDGYFRTADVIKDCNLKAFEDSIRWDYVVRALVERYGVPELYPMAAAFFKKYFKINGKTIKNTKEDQIRFPGRYIATGYGKKTAGYALASRENGHFLLYSLEIKEKRAQGIQKAVDHTKKVAAKVGVKLPGSELPKMEIEYVGR